MSKKKRGIRRQDAVLAVIFTFCGYFIDVEDLRNASTRRKQLRERRSDMTFDNWWFPQKQDVTECFLNCKHHQYTRKERIELLNLPVKVKIPSLNNRNSLCPNCEKPPRHERDNRDKWEIKVENCFKDAKTKLSRIYKDLKDKQLIDWDHFKRLDREHSFLGRRKGPAAADIVYLTKKALEKETWTRYIKLVNYRVKIEVAIYHAMYSHTIGLPEKETQRKYFEKVLEDDRELMQEKRDFIERVMGISRTGGEEQ